MDADLTPEPIAAAVARGDSSIHFAASNGRENGPYDLDAFALLRGGERISPVQLGVDGKTMIAKFAGPIQPEDLIA